MRCVHHRVPLSLQRHLKWDLSKVDSLSITGSSSPSKIWAKLQTHS
uniref:Uncharacterized protein n=1 Tax=Arundo donax TaxID=35708 RepID=A0A0A9HCM6_ARUDO